MNLLLCTLRHLLKGNKRLGCWHRRHDAYCGLDQQKEANHTRREMPAHGQKIVQMQYLLIPTMVLYSFYGSGNGARALAYQTG